MPDLPVVNYVCPSVWAWKEYRAKAMLDYVDAVLAVLPFEPGVMQRLGGPETHFVGHRLASHPNIRRVREARKARGTRPVGEKRTILLLPGSRGGEITQLLPIFGQAMEEFVARNGDTRFVLPTVPRQEARVREITAGWALRPEIVLGDEAKWRAFEDADAAIAASGTVILELALAHVPVVSTYKGDWIIRMLSHRIKIWTGALPNLIADYAVVPEYFNDVLRPASLVRWAERLSTETPQRASMLSGYDDVWQRLSTERRPARPVRPWFCHFSKERSPLTSGPAAKGSGSASHAEGVKALAGTRQASSSATIVFWFIGSAPMKTISCRRSPHSLSR